LRVAGRDHLIHDQDFRFHGCRDRNGKLKKHVVRVDFVQDNHSTSTYQHTIRGPHFQRPPFAQAKLVRADIAVDIRRSSQTFGHNVAVDIGLAPKTHTNWTLFASDDGSTDKTKYILERFGQNRLQRVVVRNGPEKGICANFLSLAINPTIEADYYAFIDQDVVWRPDKLRRALNWLTFVPDGTPGLYCGRTELMSADGQPYGLSPLFTRPSAFENALLQSLGGGNTMVLNAAAKKLLERVGRLDVVLHDWWLYQLGLLAV
jgi:glycosyltransferase involved in cell wall biosynthesis